MAYRSASWLSTKEAANRLGLTTSTLYRQPLPSNRLRRIRARRRPIRDRNRKIDRAKRSAVPEQRQVEASPVLMTSPPTRVPGLAAARSRPAPHRVSASPPSPATIMCCKDRRSTPALGESSSASGMGATLHRRTSSRAGDWRGFRRPSTTCCGAPESVATDCVRLRCVVPWPPTAVLNHVTEEAIDASPQAG